MKVILFYENADILQRIKFTAESLHFDCMAFQSFNTMIEMLLHNKFSETFVLLIDINNPNLSDQILSNKILFPKYAKHVVYIINPDDENNWNKVLKTDFCNYVIDPTDNKQLKLALTFAQRRISGVSSGAVCTENKELTHLSDTIFEIEESASLLPIPLYIDQLPPILNGLQVDILKSIYSNSFINICVTDLLFNTLFISSLYASALGETGDTMSGKNLLSFLPETLQNAIQEKTRSLEPGKSLIIRNLSTNNESKTPYNLQIQTIINNQGICSAYVFTALSGTDFQQLSVSQPNNTIDSNKLLIKYLNQIDENSKFVQLTLENMLEGCHIIDFELNYKFVNHAAARQFRISQLDVLGEKFSAICPENLNVIVYKRIESALYQRIPSHFETSIVLTNGYVGWFDMSLQPVPEGVFIRTLDLKDKKRAESELKQKKDEYLKLSEAYKEQNLNLLEMNKILEQKEEKLRFLYDNMIQGVVYLNKSGTILDANYAAQQMLGNAVSGLKKEELKLTDFNFIQENGVLYPADQNPVMNAVLHAKQLTNLIVGVFNSFTRVYNWLNVSLIPIINQITDESSGAILTLQDITDQKMQALKIEISEKKFRALFDTIQLGIIFIDRNGTFVESNSVTNTIIGDSFDALQRLSNELQPLTLNQTYKYIDFTDFPGLEALRSGNPVLNKILEGINPVTKKFLSLNISAFPITDPRTNEPMAYAVVEDITKQRLFDLENLKLRTAFEQSSSSFMIINTKGIIEDVNYRFEYDSGYLRSEVVGHSPLMLSTQIFNKEFYSNLHVEIARGKGWAGEINVKRKDNTDFWVFVIISPIRNPHGELTHFFITAQDIAQQKKDREELEEYRAHLEKIVNDRTIEISEITHKLMNLIENMPLGYLETDSEGVITAVNHAAENIFLLEREQMGGNGLWMLSNNNQNMFQKLKNSTDMVKTLTRRHVIDNIAKILRWNMIKLIGDSQQIIGIACIIEDITALKDAEIQLRQALAKERELNEMKSNFVSMTSHQFRTPLTTILSNTEMLELLFSRLNENDGITAKRFTRRIIDNIERLDLLMSDVLLVGKNQSGKIMFRPQSVHLTEFLANFVADTKFQSKDERIIEFIASGDEKPIEADPHLLSHIISNLLSNALKYSSSNAKLILEYRKADVLIIVADEGIGIPTEEQDKIFTAFFRASNTENIIGTGLGMVIVKDYVLKHGGKIYFSSAPNAGTQFFVELPYKQIRHEENTDN